ncbi:MAG: hypothetical protein NTZ49_04590 [Candidatus Parcubacteria bacterium]|nr:hypothetical protein [Candidatus Parcubacteria bacterium]
MIKRIFTVSVVVLTIFWAVGLAAFVPVAQAAVTSGDLIKASGAAVYYYAADGKRYVFPNEKTYKTWYPDFSTVKTITDAELAAIPIGGNVTMRPGVKLGKITTDPKVYAIAANGTLRWVTTAAIAECLYGATWGTKVDDISDAFFVNYTIGAPINACADFVPATATSTAVSINVDKGLSGGNQAAFNASLASDNPAAATLAQKATGVPVLKFTLSGSGTLNEVILKRTGLGNASDYVSVYLYNGNTRLTSGRSISSDTNTVTFTNINLAISGSVTLTAKVDVTDNAARATDQNALSIQSINGNAVAGVMGNLMTIGNAAASDVTIRGTSANWNVTLGTAGAELAKFSITAGLNDATVYAITLRQGGKLTNTNIANLKLKQGSYELASVAAMSSDKAIFVLGAPFTVAKGQVKNFSVFADITGGRTNDTVQFYVDQRTDLNIQDALYGVGANIIIDPSYDAAGDQTVTMQGGQITLGNAGPAATTFSANTNGNAILKVNVSSERNATVRKTDLKVQTTGAANDDLETYIKNVKLVDLDSGTTLIYAADLGGFKTTQGGATACTTAAHLNAGCWLRSSDTYDLTAGTTRHLAIKADFDSLTPNSTVLAATFDLSTASFVYDNDSSEYVLNTNIVPSSVAGVSQTVTTSGLTVTLAGIPTSAAFVRGTQAGDALGINLSAGIADSLKLNRLQARVYGDDNADFDTDGGGVGVIYTGNEDAKLLVETASLYDGSTLVKGPVNLTLIEIGGGDGVWQVGEYYRADFTNLAYAIPAGAQKKLTVRLAYRNTIVGPKYTAVSIKPSEDLEVENSTGSLLTTLSATNFNFDGLAGTPTVMQTIKTSGNVVVAVDSGTPLASLATLGNSDVVLSKYKVSAVDEAFTVKGAKIELQTAANEINLAKVKVSYKNASGTTETKLGDISTTGVVSSVTFLDGQLDMYVPVNSSAVMTISADLNSYAAGAINDAAVRLGLITADTWNAAEQIMTNDFIVLGVSSNKKLLGLTDTGVTGISKLNNTSIQNAYTYKNFPVVATSATPSGNLVPGASTLIGSFTITAGANDDLVFTKGNNNGACAVANEGCVIVHLDMAGAGAAGLVTFKDGSITLGTDTTLAANTDDVVLDFGSIVAGSYNIPAGLSKTVYVYMDTSLATGADLTTAGDSVQMSLSDGADGNIKWRVIEQTPADYQRGTIIFRGTQYGGALIKP